MGVLITIDSEVLAALIHETDVDRVAEGAARAVLAAAGCDENGKPMPPTVNGRPVVLSSSATNTRCCLHYADANVGERRRVTLKEVIAECLANPANGRRLLRALGADEPNSDFINITTGEPVRPDCNTCGFYQSARKQFQEEQKQPERTCATCSKRHSWSCPVLSVSIAVRQPCSLWKEPRHD